MRTLIVLAVAGVLFVPTFAPAFQEIRDGSNNLIGTRTKVGDRYEIRDKDNNLVGQENREGSRTIIRAGPAIRLARLTEATKIDDAIVNADNPSCLSIDD